jgi:hypothetical protein
MFLSVKYQTTFKFLYAPVMGAISHLLGHAYVIPYDEVRKYKFTSFYGLIAHSGTGKSPAFLCVTNSLLEIEIVEQITAERSSIFTQLSDKKFVNKLIKNKRLYSKEKIYDTILVKFIR